MITKFKKKSKFITAITFVLTMLLCMGATAAGAYAGQKPSSTSTPILPWTAMGSDTGEGYIYSQSGYYQEPYIFEMGWNLNEKGYKAYPDKAKIKLSDLTTITVSFGSALQDDIQNQELLSALAGLLERLKTQYADSSIPLIKPLVVSVKYVGDIDLIKLAEEYYVNDELTAFSAIFSALDYEIQKEYVDRMFQDDKLSFFSSSLRNMGNTETEFINVSAEKAYKEDRLTFFSCIVPHLTDDEKEAWIVRASRDKKNTFLAVLLKESKD